MDTVRGFTSIRYWLVMLLLLSWLMPLLVKAAPVPSNADNQLFSLNNAAFLQPPTQRDPATLRSSLITLNNAFLARFQPAPIANPSAFTGTSFPADFQLNLFGQMVTVQVQTVESLSANKVSIIGKIATDPLSSVILIKRAGVLQGNIVYNLKTYQIHVLPQTTNAALTTGAMADHVLQEIDTHKLPPDHIDNEASAKTGLSTFLAVPSVTAGGMRVDDDGSVIDVLVLYTQAARGAILDDPATAEQERTTMQDLIDLAIVETNQGYANSGIKHRLRLVYSEEVVYNVTDRSLHQPLDQLTSTNDGVLDQVHRLRDNHNADLVVMLVLMPPPPADNPNQEAPCGRGHLTLDAAHGFSVINYECATGRYSFAHEIGHNLGALHDRDEERRPSGSGYNYGFVAGAQGWSTIMAYDNNANCPAVMVNNQTEHWCTRINYWSNPDINNNNVAMGVAEGQSNAADNRKQLNNTALRVANYRLSRDAPTLISPTGNIGIHLPTYQWQAVHYATHYQITVNDRTGRKIEAWYSAQSVGCPDGKGICSITPSIPVEGYGTWWIEASNANNGYAAIGNPLSFNIVNLPGMVNTLSPEGDIGLNNPIYRWQGLTEAVAYDLSVNDSSGNRLTKRYNRGELGCADDYTSCSIMPNIILNGVSNWAVRASNAAGDGPWSNAKTFTAITPTIPPAATLIAPSGTTGTAIPTYSWNAVRNATHYQLTVVDTTGTVIDQQLSAEQAGCPAGTETCQFSSEFSRVTGNSTWSVQAFNPAGNGPIASKTFYVPNAADVPPAPSLIGPSGSAPSGDLTYGFEWQAVSNATQYVLSTVVKATGAVVMDYTYSASQLGCTSGAGKCLLQSAQTLTANQTYSWKVKALNANGEGPWSNSLDFTPYINIIE